MPLYQILHYVFPSIGCVFAHVEIQCFRDILDIFNIDFHQTHVGSDKLSELFGRNLTQTFEPGHLRIFYLPYGDIPFLSL